MKLNFLWLIAGGLSFLGIIWKGYKYNENPIFVNYNLTFLILAFISFLGAYFLYQYENS